MNKYDFAYEYLRMNHTTPFLEEVYAWRKSKTPERSRHLGYCVGNAYALAPKHTMSPLSLIVFSSDPEEALNDHLMCFDDELPREQYEQFREGWKEGYREGSKP